MPKHENTQCIEELANTGISEIYMCQKIEDVRLEIWEPSHEREFGEIVWALWSLASHILIRKTAFRKIMRE